MLNRFLVHICYTFRSTKHCSITSQPFFFFKLVSWPQQVRQIKDLDYNQQRAFYLCQVKMRRAEVFVRFSENVMHTS